MADEKKEEKKGLTHLEEVYVLLFIVACLGLISWRIQDYYNYYFGGGSIWDALAAYFHARIEPFLRILSYTVSVLSLWGIVYSYSKLSAIKKEEEATFGAQTKQDSAPAPLQKNEKWERVISHVNSVNSSDWRLAVLEADIMLDELLQTLGYHGESLGERLKSVEKSDFLTLDNAWEAHRVRNQIAHQGADYPLSEREAKRAIALYESVFKEFQII